MDEKDLTNLNYISSSESVFIQKHVEFLGHSIENDKIYLKNLSEEKIAAVINFSKPKHIRNVQYFWFYQDIFICNYSISG